MQEGLMWTVNVRPLFFGQDTLGLTPLGVRNY